MPSGATPELFDEWQRFLALRANSAPPSSPPTPPSPPVKKRKRYPIHNCAVCLHPCLPLPSSSRYVTCCQCSLSVHIECYGISKMSKAHSRQLRRRWKCERCKELPTQTTPPTTPTQSQCMYCPSTAFALKKSTTGMWVHVVCALFIPGLALTLHFQHYGSTLPLPVTMPLSTKKKHRSFHLVTGANDIPEELYELGCDLCGVGTGVCIQCVEKECNISYHVTCAMMKGWCVRVEEVEEEGKVGKGGGEVAMRSWCDRHTPSDWEKREEGGGRYVMEGKGVRKVSPGEVIELDGEWDEEEEEEEGEAKVGTRGRESM